MVNEKCFELNWINGIKKSNAQLNPVYAENTIYAFELLSELVNLNIDFVFKGGTSLLLHFPQPRRLSTDIDIIGDFDLEIFDAIIKKNPRFQGFKDADRKHDLPMIKNLGFYYDTVLPDVDDQFVLLDIIKAKPRFPKIEEKEIKCDLLETDEALIVKIPTVESLLGDKLTAFAPDTIGIPLEDDTFRPVNVIKQLFDISLLFDAANDLQEINEAYNMSHKLNCEIRDQHFKIDETLNDTIQTCLELSSEGFSVGRNYAQTIMNKGCNRLNQFLISEPFSVNLAKKHAAKVALIATILKKERFDLKLIDLKYTKKKIEQLRDAKIHARFSKLMPLKESDAEAFYYWYLTSQIEEGKL
ncbi:MAG: hypothetical protein APR54_01610 [Candidatus Cloacimonas sp. SDB]|nr:MAG: hypothetical protein APR54_01610 [Candidatus Cloacimonas sp. SDB]